MKEIHFMVGEEIKKKKRIEGDRKEGEAEGGQPGKKRGPMAGEKEGVQCQCVCLCFYLHHTVLGSSLVSVTFLSPSVHGLSGYLNSLHLAPTPAVRVPFPPVYWELARSRILRS